MLETPAGVSALGAVLSALFAGLAFVFSRRLSPREKLDILKAEILRVVSIEYSKKDWDFLWINSTVHEGDGVGPDARSLAIVLGPKYIKYQWVVLIPAAVEELKHEGYGDLLGL